MNILAISGFLRLFDFDQKGATEEGLKWPKGVSGPNQEECKDKNPLT